MQPADTSKAPVPVAVGKVLAQKYRVERILGRGGMGVVVEARHLELDEPRAIKFLMPHAVEHKQSVERFMREARAAARLKSRHVATVFDVGRLDSAPYMVMEFLDGIPFDALLRLRGPLPCGEVCAMMMQAMEAIDEAHDHGIVHRDLKPANLFLARGLKNRPTVKVLDFGISKLLTLSGGMDLTRTTTLLGSPYYMSPEQMMAARDIDGRTDIWSLGVIMYKLITGRVPFKGETITQQGVMVVSHPAPPPSQFQPEIPAELEAIIMRCLEKEREERFADVDALMRSIATFATILPSFPTATEAVEQHEESPQSTFQENTRTSNPIITPHGTISIDTDDSIGVDDHGREHTTAQRHKTQPLPSGAAAPPQQDLPEARPSTSGALATALSPSSASNITHSEDRASEDTLQFEDIPRMAASSTNPATSSERQSTNAPWDATADETREEPEKKRSWMAAAFVACVLVGGIGYFFLGANNATTSGASRPSGLQPHSASQTRALVEPSAVSEEATSTGSALPPDEPLTAFETGSGEPTETEETVATAAATQLPSALSIPSSASATPKRPPVTPPPLTATPRPPLPHPAPKPAPQPSPGPADPFD